MVRQAQQYLLWQMDLLMKPLSSLLGFSRKARPDAD